MPPPTFCYYELLIRRILIAQNRKKSEPHGKNNQKLQFDVQIEKFKNHFFELPPPTRGSVAQKIRVQIC